MRHHLLRAAIAAAVLTLPLAAMAEGESCELAPQKDGFVALRDGPSPSAKLVARMDPKGAVIPRTKEPGWRRGTWIKVSYWRPGIEFDEAFAKGPVGWMNEKLHQGCG